MHDVKLLRDNLGALRDGMRRRQKLDALAPQIDRAEELDRDRRALIQITDDKKAARNTPSQEVARRKRAKESADDLIAQTRALGDDISRLEAQLSAVEGELERILLDIANSPSEIAPDDFESLQHRIESEGVLWKVRVTQDTGQKL